MPAIDDLSSIVIEQADRLFEGEVTRERLAEFDRGVEQTQIWNKVVESGLPLAMAPETAGGAGLAVGPAFRVLRRAGYFSLPVPLAEAMLANWIWCEAGDASLQGRVTLAPPRPADAISIAAQSRGYRLTGNAARVPWASQADELIVFARDGAGQAFIARVAPPEGQRRRNLAFEPRDDLRFDVSIAADAVRAAPPRLHDDGFLALGALMRAQQLVGAMERCMDYAVSYAMERQQFGRPIAKFQAIQHMLAEAAGHYAAATAAADLALDAWDGEDFAFNVGIAKARVGEAAGKVAEITHQVHGAMGFTQEHPLHFSTRRLWSWREEFGSESYWQDRIGRAVCATGGDGLWPRLVGG